MPRVHVDRGPSDLWAGVIELGFWAVVLSGVAMAIVVGQRRHRRALAEEKRRFVRCFVLALPEAYRSALEPLVSVAASHPTSRALSALRDALVEHSPHVSGAMFRLWRSLPSELEARVAEMVPVEASDEGGAASYRGGPGGQIVVTMAVMFACELPQVPPVQDCASLEEALRLSVPAFDPDIDGAMVRISPSAPGRAYPEARVRAFLPNLR